jgi:hypothetical protein
MIKIRLNIAGIRFEISSSCDLQKILNEKKLIPFISPKDNTYVYSVKLRLEEYEGAIKPKGSLVLDGGAVGKIFRDKSGYCAEFSYYNPANVLFHHGILFAGQKWVNLRMYESKQSNHRKWLCFLRGQASDLILRNAMIYTNGIIFHAAFITINGKGICLLGHSGEGKSTISKILSSANDTLLVNEDHAAVRIVKDVAIAYGTPWAGSSTALLNENAPIKSIILLEKANENIINALSVSKAVPLVLARSFLPYWDTSLMQIAIGNVHAILKAVPVYLLRCRPESEIIPLVRSVL